MAFLYKNRLNSSFIDEKNAYINKIVYDKLLNIPNLHIIGKERNIFKIPIFSFLITFNGYFLHYNFVCALLNDLFGIQSRGGCMCASLLGAKVLGIKDEILKKLEKLSVEGKEIFRPGFTRVNFHYSMDETEINYILTSINFIACFGWMFISLYKFKIESGKFYHYNKKDDYVWLNNFNKTDDNFNKNTILYSENNFDLNESNKYVLEAYNTLLNLNIIIKNTIGKSKVNNKILFSETNVCSSDDEQCCNDKYKERLEKYRWFLISDDCEDYLNSSYSKIEEFIKKMIKDDSINVDNCENSINIIKSDKMLFSLYIKSLDNICFGSELEMLSNTNNLDYNNEISNELINKSTLNKIDKNIEKDIVNKEFDYDLSDNLIKKEIKDIILFPQVPKNITSLVGEAIIAFNMIKEGDKILIGLSGGKDSMSLIHILLYFKKKAPVKFDIGVITVDPQSDDYKPEPLKEYLKLLGIPYFFESDPILERAKKSMKNEKSSICAFCSRMKRGIIYSCARREGYNVIALGQHLDDIAESFLMSIFHNGILRTMKAHYTIDEGDLRVIRPLIYCREKIFKEFAKEAKLPIIQENCPACFSAPKERLRVKMLLSQQENLFPNLYSSIKIGLIPLMKGEIESSKKKDDIDI